MLDVLVFAPHPDDAELGAGGAIVKAVDEGLAVGIIDLTAGEMGSLGNKETRLKEADKAKKILGVKIRENLGFPDANLPFEDKKKAILFVASKIREYQPKVVLIPNWKDRHPDHSTTSDIVTNACHYAKLKKVELDHPRYKVNQMIYYELNGQFSPSYILDISQEFERKKEAIMTYKSQFKEFSKEYLPFPVYERCRFYGSLILADFGEAFFLKNPIALKDWKIFF
ncbi:MAG: bacillithiol biosynthesis deacetylase BshB1 [Candidatus Heimdallarchaeota archaeon]